MSKQMEAYERLTAAVVKQLQEGKVPWEKPWVKSANLKSGRQYSGINAVVLSVAAQEKGYKSPFWTTFNAAKEMGGMVRKGEKATLVAMWKEVSKSGPSSRDEAKETTLPAGRRNKDSYLMCKTYCVFNLDQIDGIPLENLPKHAKDFLDREQSAGTGKGFKKAEKIVADMPEPPSITHAGTTACYSPSLDAVMMPPAASFKSEEQYYCTLFHELGHSTGAEKRLNRLHDDNFNFGSPTYAKEELIAEFSASSLLAEAGIDTTKTYDNSAAYCANWLTVLQNDPSILVKAAAGAQKASDWVLGKHASQVIEQKEEAKETYTPPSLSANEEVEEAVASQRLTMF